MEHSKQINLDTLNPQQKRAVTTTVGPVLLLAGAGTGKTSVIIYRIAYLIQRGVAPEHVLALTFTNKAAREMKERVAEMLDSQQADKVTTATFHSFALRLLRNQIRLLGYSSQFDIAPQSYQQGLLKSIISELGLVDKTEGVKTFKHLISTAKNNLIEPGDEQLQNQTWPAAFPEVYKEYQKRLQNMNLIDFDDMPLLLVKLWRQYPDILRQHQNQYHYVLIDEYQDTNHAQFAIMTELAGTEGNVCAVGDDDQSIYGWRGADIQNILRFENHFQNASVLRLEKNYRSTNTILEATNHLIAHNSERHSKQLWSEKKGGDKIQLITTSDENEEADTVKNIVQEICAGGYEHADVAVLYRSNSQSRVLESVFRKTQIPYTLIGSQSFFDRREIMDAVSFLKAILNPKDDLSILRIINVPPRGIGDKAVERLKELQAKVNKPLQELLADKEYVNDLPATAATNAENFQKTLEKYRTEFQTRDVLADTAKKFFADIGYLGGLGKMYKPKSDALARKENVEEFINSIAEYERQTTTPSLRDFIEQCTLMNEPQNTADDSENAQGVTLMTVHAAKGLEFPVVLVVGMEQGLFPHQQALDENREQEERRLFYVAGTRAKDNLYCLRARSRHVKGKPRRRRASTLLNQLPDELLEEHTPEDAIQPATKEETKAYIEEMKAMLSPGSQG